MSKTPPRRTARKKLVPPPRRLDDDLAELAAVLAEYELEDHSTGWFIVPWKDGWNAVGLALAVTNFDSGLGALTMDERHAYTWLNTAWSRRVETPSVLYEKAGELLHVTGSRLLRASLRCLQVMTSNSDGGGNVYNAILTSPFQERLVCAEVASTVLEHRCRDSIGVTATLSGDGHDRVRRAFRIAWERGLYRAAYALPPVVR